MITQIFYPFVSPVPISLGTMVVVKVGAVIIATISCIGCRTPPPSPEQAPELGSDPGEEEHTIYILNPPTNYEDFWGFKSQGELFDYVNGVSGDASPLDQYNQPRLPPNASLWRLPKEVVRFPAGKVESVNDQPEVKPQVGADEVHPDSREMVITVSNGPAEANSTEAPQIQLFNDETITIDPTPIYLSSSTGVFYTARTENTGTIRARKQQRPMLIKYHLDCVGEDARFDPVNSIILESFFMEKLAPVGLSPPVYYYSDTAAPDTYSPVPALTAGSTATSPDIFEKLRGKVKCFTKDVQPSVRYLVSEHVGKSIAEFVAESGKIPILFFVDIMRLGGQMMTYLEKLHSYNVIHGDAHLHNWASFGGRITMIDFGRSRLRFESEIVKQNNCRLTEIIHHLWTTKWELVYCTNSFRDDVYNALFMVAAMIHGGDLLDFVSFLATNAGDAGKAEHVRLKSEALFFDYSLPSSTGITVTAGIRTEFSLGDIIKHTETLASVRALLTEITTEIITIDSIEKKADYPKIKFLFAEIIKLLDPNAKKLEKFEDLFRLVL